MTSRVTLAYRVTDVEVSSVRPEVAVGTGARRRPEIPRNFFTAPGLQGIAGNVRHSSGGT